MRRHCFVSRYAWGILLTLLLLIGCSGQTPLPPTPTPAATPSPPPPPATPTPPPLLPDTGWEALQPGLERRIIFLLTDDGHPYEQLYLLRLEPARFRFDIAYHAGEPQTLSDWQAETGALVVMNGGYFTPEFMATGLIAVDGEASGVSYGDFAGMFAITPRGPELRWLAEQPYDPAEPLRAALQSFPMLIKPGAQPGYPDEDGRPSRRGVIAQDRQGRLLLLAAGWGSFTLHGLSEYLLRGDLDLDRALNLDGGTSTGLLLADPAEGVGAMVAVPTVILVYPR